MHCINDIKALCNCRECLGNAIKYSDSAAVKCPYRDAQYSCDSTLQDREIRAVSYLTFWSTVGPCCTLYLSCIVIHNYNNYSNNYGRIMLNFFRLIRIVQQLQCDCEIYSLFIICCLVIVVQIIRKCEV